MNKVLAIAALVIAVPLSGLLAVAATKPNSFRYQRSTAIKASPERLFAIISDYRQWPSWSPWQKLDPAMKTTLSGAARGKGAVFEWQGNREVGSGRIEIVDVAEPSRVTMKLDMLTPFPANNIVDYTLEPAGDLTLVTWAMNGPQPFIAKVMGTLFNLEKMMGKVFDEGLANLKALAEA